MKYIVKRMITVFCILALAVSMCSCSNTMNRQLSYVERELSLSLKHYYIDDEVETHGGFLGDGETYYVLKADDDAVDIYEQIHGSWAQLPLSDELNEIIYGSIYGSDAMTYDVTIPKIENGYYYFADRSKESENGPISYDIHPSRSDLYNFTFAIYDSDNDVLVYYELDT